MNYIKLSDYAKKFGVTYRTAWNRYQNGKIKGCIKDETNHVLVPVELINFNSIKSAALYARVSNNDAKDNLERQSERLSDFAVKNGFKITREIKEIGSGLNDSRTKLVKLLSSLDDWDILIVENKDRLTRFGFNYIEILLNQMGKEILVINETSDNKTDLVQDLVSIIYSFSARIYGLRRAKNKQQEILEVLEEK